jgi:hypothetical protein
MWAIVRRVFSALGLIVALAGIGVFVGTAVTAWRVKAEVIQRTDDLVVQARTAVDAGDHAVSFVREVINRADQDLNATRQTMAMAPREPANPFLRLTAQRASQNLAGSVERASAALVAASDAVVVGESALQLLGQDELVKKWLGVKPEQLAQSRAGLGTASNELQRVRTVLGIPVEGAQPTPEQLVTVEAALGQARDFTEQMGRVVADARKQIEDLKQAVDQWALRVALGVSALCALATVGQLFMLRSCWRGLRK